MTDIRSRQCEHGLSAADGRYQGLWAAPFSRCKCCGIDYPYIDSFQMSASGKSSGRYFSKDRCQGCGGVYADWSYEPQETLT
jgi:hypothetical protein